MSLGRPVERLTLGLMAAFVIVGLANVYWSVLEAPSLLAREDNVRAVLVARSVVRGSLMDRDGVVLAETRSGGLGQAATRVYHYDTMHSALGYASFRYGTGGVEAAYDALLTGNTLPLTWDEALLNTPRQGHDVRLTLDLDVQRALADAMATRSGAGVVLAVPTGQVLASVSLPTYNPNTLDTDWPTLVSAPGDPFFNRVQQGRYQPGSMMQTPLLLTALVRGQPLNARFEVGGVPFQLDDLTIPCAAAPPSNELALSSAYLYSCPRPFVQLALALGGPHMSQMLSLLRLDRPPVLMEGLVGEPVTLPTLVGSDVLIREALGQGTVQVSPLSMVMLAGAMVNGGGAPQPYTVLATRAPNGVWEPVPAPRGGSFAFATDGNARTMADLMRQSVADGAARWAAVPGLDIGGHAGLAYAGDETLAWFVGFVTTEAGQSASVAVVLEDTDEAAAAAEVGRTALVAAHAALQAAAESGTGVNGAAN